MFNKLLGTRNYIRADFAVRSLELSHALLDICGDAMSKQDAQGPPSACESVQTRSEIELFDVVSRGLRHRKPPGQAGIPRELVEVPMGTVIQQGA